MKKILTVFGLALLTIAAQASVIVIDPGHGTYTANDRPAATISYPNLSNGMPAKDVGFYESNTNLWKAEALKDHLVAAGHTVHMTRTKNGTSPALSTRAALATSKSAAIYISIHSNASSDGDYINYLYLALSGHSGVASSTTTAQKKVATACWPYVFDFMGSNNSSGGYVHEWPSHYTYTSTKIAKQSLGAMRHARPGYLSEGFFHTYHPSRHRALNKDWCRQEGVRHFRGFQAYLGKSGETNGDIMGVLKRSDKTMTNSKTLKAGQFSYTTKSTHDKFYPCNGATVYLYDGAKTQVLKTDTVDNNWNGVFVFENLSPGTYYLGAKYDGCGNVPESYRKVTVKANTTVYPVVLIKSGTFSQPTEDAYTNGGSVSTVPTITASVAAVNLTAVQGAAAPSKSVTIKASNLTADMTITNSSSVITHKTSSWNARTGGTLTFSCPTTTIGTQTADVTIKSGTESITIDVTAVISEAVAITPTEPAKEGTATFSKLWSFAQDKSGYLTTGSNNRSIAHYNGKLYIPQKDKGTFHEVNASTGKLIATRTIGTSSFLHHNLRITDDGQMLLGNTEAGTKVTSNITVLTSNVSSGGQATAGTGLMGGRSDFFYTYGNWNGTGYLIAANNEIEADSATGGTTMKFTKIPFSNGKLGTAVNLSNTMLPSSYASAKIIPVDDKTFLASSIGNAPSLHNLATGDVLDNFGEIQPEPVGTNGVAVFTIHGHRYIVAALDRAGSFEIYDVTQGLSKATKMADMTGASLGDKAKNDLATIDFCTYISGNDVYIYELAPNIGIAAYKFTFTPKSTDSGTTTPSTPDVTYGNVKFHFQGGTLNVPADNEALWNTMWAEFKAEYPSLNYTSSTFVTPVMSDETLGTKETSIGRFLKNNFTENSNNLNAAGNDYTLWTTGIWKWLGDYIQLKSPSVFVTSAWTTTTNVAFETQGFLQQKKAAAYSEAYPKGDWTTAGKPENWAAAYIFGHKPVKANAVFLGWYLNANASGSPLTSLPSSGDVYACWQSNVSTDAEAIEKTSTTYILPTFSGVEIFFEGTQTIVIYNLNGMQVAGGVSTDYYACDLQSGMYLIRIGNEAYKFVK